MSKSTEHLRLAIERGYSITKEGSVIGTKGILSLIISGKQDYYYFNIRLSKSKIVKIYAHRLQAYFKYGEAIFEEGIVVRHLNGNSKDNSYDNISIGTQGDNMRDIPKLQRRLSASNPKYNHEDILKDRNLGMTYSQLTLKYGCSKSSISFIINKSLKKEGII